MFGKRYVELKRKKATKVFDVGLVRSVKLYNTEVVQFDKNRVKLNTGGWFTSTTKNRMNQASRDYGLGYSVYQKKHQWFAEHKGKKYSFKNGFLEFDR